MLSTPEGLRFGKSVSAGRLLFGLLVAIAFALAVSSAARVTRARHGVTLNPCAPCGSGCACPKPPGAAHCLCPR